MKLKLEDLIPEEAEFELSKHAGRKFVLKKFSLADQIWAKRTFGNDLERILREMDLAGVAELTFHLVKDKTGFKDFLEFADSIITHDDKLTIYKSLLKTIGVSQPILDEIQKGQVEIPNV